MIILTVLSRLFGKLSGLPRAETYDVLVERDLQVPMPDGVVLLADRYVPRGADRLPVILVRSPYGRSGFYGLLFAQLFAERGFQVLIQSVRGTFGSGGGLGPLSTDHDDGLATIAWIKQQPWFNGLLATNGPSYLGYVQWAIARDAGQDIQAMAIQISSSELRGVTYMGGSFALDLLLSWTHQLAFQERFNMLGQMYIGHRTLRRLYSHLPLRDLDQLATGMHSIYFQDWLEHTEPGDPYWQERDFSGTLKDITIPVLLTAGWYDIFLPWMLRDYRLLREAGRQPYLTIGPWAHTSFGLMAEANQEALVWFSTHLLKDRRGLREMPVRIFVTGANDWREYPDWPPPGIEQQRYHLQPCGSLALDLPPASEPDRYRYDPANPTPAVCGPRLLDRSEPVDNRQLEARPDVLTYTTAPLDRHVEVIGPVQADLYVRSSLEHTDFFARLCDVYPDGKSMNVCDALQRLSPSCPPPLPDGTRRVTIDLWPTAHRFRKGHRIRLQVSSGAHPRYARNTGSGEPLATATKLFVADQSIYHDPEHPSGVVLSVMKSTNQRR
jgi:putative CocE/NonD family hydrolase